VSRKKTQKPFDVRAVLEQPVARAAIGGRHICAYEAAMRRNADLASKGDMRSAGRFLKALVSYGLLEIPPQVDDHRYVEWIPKEWEPEAWEAMYAKYGSPPWRGDFDGLIPEERWDSWYGPRPKRPAGPKRRARRK
jgi:hypothetical protein